MAAKRVCTEAVRRGVPPLLSEGGETADVYRLMASHIEKALSSLVDPLPVGTVVEIEAKLGRLVSSQTGTRLELPISCETIVTSRDVRFEADMTVVRVGLTQTQHRHFNDLLNRAVRAEQLKYTRRREIDRFYETGTVHGRRRVRATVDEVTGKPVANGVITKTRFLTINVHVPTSPLDYRVTLSTEQTTKIPPRTVAEPLERRKDRLSYTHEWLQFDLTQVREIDTRQEREAKKMHELEIEFTDGGALISEKRLKDAGHPNLFQESITHLIQNVRWLVSEAPPFETR